jgi:molybdate transport system ATP-binding protein
MRLILKDLVVPLADFTLEVDAELQGRVTAIFGPSGSGKTSLLDLLAGLRPAKTAFVQLDERVLTDTRRGILVPARKRGIGYVPQDLALFPHLSVRGNLLYGHRSSAAGDGRITLAQVLAVLEIEPLLQRGVGQLSGGEKQRVALARALLAAPRLLLLDEPLASLDAKLKARILPYLTRIRDEFHVPMIYVTHDRAEALAMADDVVVLVNGKVAQIGRVDEVFSRPANLQVAGLVAVESVQPGRIISRGEGLARVAVGSAILSAIEPEVPADTADVFVCIRAEDVILMKGLDVPSSPRNHMPGVVRSLTREGPLMRIELDCGFALSALLTKQACQELGLEMADAVIALVKAPHVHLIPR